MPHSLGMAARPEGTGSRYFLVVFSPGLDGFAFLSPMVFILDSGAAQCRPWKNPRGLFQRFDKLDSRLKQNL